MAGALADGDNDPAHLLLLSVVSTTLLFDLYRWPSVATAFVPLLILKVPLEAYSQEVCRSPRKHATTGF